MNRASTIERLKIEVEQIHKKGGSTRRAVGKIYQCRHVPAIASINVSFR